MNPEYPVYIISKGRADTRMTSRALEKMNMPYKIVIEPQEYDLYAAVIDPKKILILPFSNLGMGSIPARNWVWEHSISIGAKRHWILDDNIQCFLRFNRNRQIQVSDGTIFKCAEDFTDRYENVGISGLEYFMFVPRKTKTTPYRLNTRIYSCILIKNDIPYRWRGRYNEDTDLSIRALKDGWCTILFQAFLCLKTTTMTMKGGNTEDLYKIKEGDKDGRYLMAESLQKQHPDITKITWKWNRWQHHVDYSRFKINKLIKKPGLIIPEGINNYGMVLKSIEKKEQSNTIKASIPTNKNIDDKKYLYIKPEEIPDTEEDEEENIEIKQEPIIIEEPKEIQKEYTGEYIVSFSYGIEEKDSWGSKPIRFTGTKRECEVFSLDNNQPKLFEE